ncbi:TonB-dependent receptor [uncultured Microbulbifer sp.]|uniref:TonB-dependent receptor domain-containing protein n=1 Tax=uncultured Microbulbifer sp. TaxID=348147 RepID=UPI00262F5347|nr:TonB-dependent receptor [uncultured Microbulbifer sp.]
MRFRCVVLFLLMILSSVLPVKAAQALEKIPFVIPQQRADLSLTEFAQQADLTLIFPFDIAQEKTANRLVGAYSIEEAVEGLLSGTGLSAKLEGDGLLSISIDSARGGVNSMRLDFCKPQKKAIAQTIREVQQSKHSAPAWCSAALAYLAITATPASAQSNEEADSKAIEEITVTAQKIEESIQDVPIAVSAISGDTMGDLKIERGDELVRAVPNVNFSKANFSTYNFSIRGVGTKAISASTDPAVAVSFNNAPMIRNRLYEQEFFDVQRVEVLRGPQGTLYGRNATAGVVNMLPQMPTPEFESNIKGEVGSYNTRRTSAMLNVPLGDTLAMRFSGAMTQRSGYDYNTFTDNDVNDRDLYSTRVILQWEPSEVFNANLIWQHFEEDDNRSRTGKQLCTRDPGPDMVGEAKVSDQLKPQFSQGCLLGSLYDGDAFGAPNGQALAFLRVHSYPLGVPLGQLPPTPDRPYNPLPHVKNIDPYKNVKQSRDLHEIETSYDPVFRAENDVAQLNLELALGDSLRLFAQSTYAKDDYYSSQDYNRYLSAPVFNDSAREDLFGLGGKGPNRTFTLPGISPGGVFTDPQLGPSDRMLAVDISQSDNRQLSQELRLQSAFDGSFNFSLGANYLDFESQDDYYVFNNLFTHLATTFYPPAKDEEGRPTHSACDDTRMEECIYVDPNPLGQLNEEGHNYFLSRNLVKTRSSALFGETYWQMTDDVKLTAGLRYTEDRKTATPIPSQLLLGTRQHEGEFVNGGTSGGKARRGYPRGQDIKQKWQEFTGRLVLDWRTETPFTDETLFYTSFSHGYKGGGSNPPRVDIDTRVVQYQPLAETFEPEFVNAFEFGAKNTLLDGSLQVNATAFYYDYKAYQISQIVDRISYNENFDTETWGLELESAWQLTLSTRMDFNLGYLQTRIADGEGSIDVMNRTQGNADWMLVRPTLQVPSNCIAPRHIVEKLVAQDAIGLHVGQLCGGAINYGTYAPVINPNRARPIRLDVLYNLGETYDPLIQAPNGGRGFSADLSGNELPNAPRFTANLGLEHVIQVMDWDLKLRADYYRQGESYARVYNTEYDRLEAWSNLNVSATFTQPEWDLQMQLYVKNVFDDAPITDFFTNSDDTGLSTNVFTLDPRIVGLSVYKGF